MPSIVTRLKLAFISTSGTSNSNQSPHGPLSPTSPSIFTSPSSAVTSPEPTSATSMKSTASPTVQFAPARGIVRTQSTPGLSDKSNHRQRRSSTISSGTYKSWGRPAAYQVVRIPNIPGVSRIRFSFTGSHLK